ncbi:general stress protein [Acidiphilium sp. PA]|uniref:hypothetical protein n=1 Tax=Acidiphilium sp. PA TaxID=2871705 RepID=UPI0022436C76|nr:hypothetical protein [Acidiphilium sp. PA]MCW8308559.1 general stress protein [Acidiphilium sp. PA]
MNAINPADQTVPPLTSQARLAQHLRAEAIQLVEDLRAKGVTEDDAVFTWSSGIAASFIHLAGLLDGVGTELGTIATTFADSRAAFRRDVVDASRAQHEILRTEIERLRLKRAEMETDLQAKIDATVKKLGQQIVEANKSANVIFQRRWNLRHNIMGAAIAGAVLLACVIGGYAWRSVQEGNAVSGRYACEQAPMTIATANGDLLTCPLRDLVSATTLTRLNHRFLKEATPPAP